MTSSTAPPLFFIDKGPGSSGSKASGPAIEKKNKKSMRDDFQLHGYPIHTPSQALRFLHRNSSASRVFEEKAITKDPNFVSQTSIGPLVGKRLAARLRKDESGKTAGEKWFNMPAVEVDETLEKDISLINMRDALAANRFYKRNSGLKSTKFMQVGTIVGTPADFYNDLPRRARKRTLVEELTADVDTRAWHKRKYAEVLASNPYYLKEKRRQEAKKAKEKKAAAAARMQSTREPEAAAAPDAEDFAPGFASSAHRSHYKGKRRQEKQTLFQTKKRGGKSRKK